MVHLHSDEAARLRRQASELGMADPVEQGRLRQEGGRCVFLQPDQLCAIHARWGAEAKPRVCRQAPLVAIRVKQGLRVGVDPGCLTSWRSWRVGPEIPAGELAATTAPLTPSLQKLEDAVIDLLGVDGMTVAEALAAMAGQPPPADGALHEGFASRLCERLRRLPLASKLDHEGTAPALRSALEGVARVLPDLDPDSPPPWPVLSPEADAFAVDVARKVVFLRLVADLGHPTAVAVLVLCGAIAAGWAHPEMERFAPALSAWSRLVRAPANVGVLMPDAASLETLLLAR